MNFALFFGLAYQMSAPGEKNLIELGAQIINNSFNTNHCLYFTTDCDSCPHAQLVIKTITSLFIPLVIVPSDKSNADDLFCNGYVIASTNFAFVKNLFLKHDRRKLSPKARLRVVVVYDKIRNLVEYGSLGENIYGSDIILIEGFSPQKDTRVFSVRNGAYLDLKGMNYPTEKWAPKFKRGKFNVSLFNCPPFVYYNEKQGVYDGTDLKMLREIAQGWPLHYNVYTEDEPNPYRAVILDVLKRRSELAVCSQWQFVLSKQPVDMSVPYTQNCITFLVPKPTLLPDSSYTFQPFSSNLWMAFALSCVLFAALLHSFSLAYAKINQANRFADFAYGLLQVVGTVSLGSTPPPTQTVFRVLLNTWCIYALVLSTGYSAGFTTTFTSPRLSGAIKTLQDMADRKLLWGEKGTDALQAAANSTNPTIQSISRNYITYADVQERNLRISRERNFAVIVKTLPGGYVTETETLDDYGMTHLKILMDCLQTYLIVFAFPKNSPFTEYFNERILRYLECGLTQRWYHEISYMYGMSKHVSNFQATFGNLKKNPLKMRQLQGAFYLLSAGLILAFIVFVCEFYFGK